MKENKIEKFILDLSNRWECTPQEAVDRLNSMNESEINKLIKSMIKKFQGGGQTGNNGVQVFGHRFPDGAFYTINDYGNGETDEYLRTGSDGDQKKVYRKINRKPNYSKIPLLSPLDSVITIRKPSGAELQITSPYSSKTMVSPELWKSLNDQMDARKAEALSFKNGGVIDCLRAGGNLTECKKCGGKAAIKAQKGEKMLRTDGVSGYAYRKSDGTLVLTRDGKGPVPLPGSSYQMPGYEPPMSTEMRVETDKGGKPVRYEVDVYEGDESLLPYRTYSSDPSWWQFTRRRLTKEALQRYIDAYKANGLLRNGGKVTSKPDSSKYVNMEKEWGKSQKTSGIEKSDSTKNEKYVDLRKKLPLNKQITKPIPGIKK